MAVLATGWGGGLLFRGVSARPGYTLAHRPHFWSFSRFPSPLSLHFSPSRGCPLVRQPLPLSSPPPTPGAERGAPSQPPPPAPKLLSGQRSTDAARDTPASPALLPGLWASRLLFCLRCSWGPWGGVLAGRDALPGPAGPAACVSRCQGACVLLVPVSRPAHAGTTGARGLPAGATSLRMSRVLARLPTAFA